MIKIRATVPDALRIRTMVPEGVRVQCIVDAELVKDEPEQTPVAYLYNEIEIPTRIPELTDEQKQEYPYILMWKNTSIYATVWFGKHPAIVFVGSSGHDCVGFSEEGTILKNAYRYTGNSYVPAGWGTLDETSYTHNNARLVPQTLIWANHDILNQADGSLYLATSEPVPVYE